MTITDKALGTLEKTGISISIVILIAAAIFVYYQLQQIKLVNLQIRSAERDLGMGHRAPAPLEELIAKITI